MLRITFDDGDYLDYRQGSGNTIEIYDIVVTTERRIGKGRRMVNHLLRGAALRGTNLVWAITRADNFIAQQFYEGINFRVVGVLRDFYRDQEYNAVDAIMYGRNPG